eukprot:CAMPEP_0118933302 /NCGR_PEP_ID=MMETSP1169-20130426/11911_1 /TAXON_ID=36882 /ORGANISM="Pyramimonas obovata, Strain CCMP722" /LENGTH=428 /DNA_ID=CAMNT_0006876045 /DNA_START=51 /DNA_END=1337 /DNA_ORIENTATION=-
MMRFPLSVGRVARARTVALGSPRICGPSLPSAVRLASGATGGSTRGTVVYAAKGGFGKKSSKTKRKRVDKAKDTQFIEKEGSTANSNAIDQYKDVLIRKEENKAQASTDDEFAAKVAALKAKQPERPAEPVSAGKPRTGAAFDIVTTQLDTPKEEETDNSRLPLQIGAIFSVIAFLFVYSASDLQLSAGGGLKVKTGSRDLDPELKAEFQREAFQFEARLDENPNDAEAVEGAAVVYAQLGEYKKADGFLETLTKMKPNDVEVFRLLAETKAQEGDYAASAAQYQAALKLSPDNLELLRGYITVLGRDNKQEKAVAVIAEVRPRAERRGNQGVEGSASDPADAVQLELLLGKVYGEWPGHSADAVAVYNRMIENYKDDFRGYLAKGAILKDIGKTKDAERMFLQARYLAPEAARPLVDQVANRPSAAS